MIENQWYGILDSREVAKGRPVGVTRLGQRLVLWRDQASQVHCLSDQCCHRGAALSIGSIREGRLVCPFHGFVYDVSGKVTQIPANGRNTAVAERYHVQAWPVCEQDGFIWLWYGKPSPSLPPVPFFNELRNGFSYDGFAETWPVHYSRAIENQLDVVHLPFVHANSIGRGNQTLVHGPVVEWDDRNCMTFYVSNVVDDGQTRPLKPEEIANYRDLFHLNLQMPNLWQNRISDQVRIVVVFAPIDEEHTRIYIRFYQCFIRVPGLRRLVNYFSRFSNRYILHQDRRVVVTQIPKKTGLKMQENLIQGDAPIIAYRQRRARLQGEVNEQ